MADRRKSKKNTEITIRSSAAEYLTYVAATGDNADSFEMRYETRRQYRSRGDIPPRRRGKRTYRD